MGRGLKERVQMTSHFSHMLPDSSAQGHQALSLQTFLFYITVQKGRGLHQVVLPQDLCEKFLSSEKNTKKGIETYGVLCGALVKI